MTLSSRVGVRGNDDVEAGAVPGAVIGFVLEGFGSLGAVIGFFCDGFNTCLCVKNEHVKQLVMLTSP